MDQSAKAREDLAQAFHAEGDFELEKLARNGYYGDFTSPLAMPATQLILDATAKGYTKIVKRAMNGDFDG